MDDRQLTRLADAAHALRPDWPARSVRAYLAGKHRDKAFADVAVALAVVATDPATTTPARLDEHGPWWTATRALMLGATPDVGPGRGVEACAYTGHEHEPARGCRLCRAEQLAGEHHDRPAVPTGADPVPAPADWRPTIARPERPTPRPPTPAGAPRSQSATVAADVPPHLAEPVTCAVCRSSYLDYDAGRDAHATVFGHRPVVRDERGARVRVDA